VLGLELNPELNRNRIGRGGTGRAGEIPFAAGRGAAGYGGRHGRWRSVREGLLSLQCPFPAIMGVPLFDFAANIGKKVFNRGEDKAAEKLKKHIEANNPGVSGLDVVIEGETATITGTAKDQAAYEKAVLLAGNVEGVGKVEAGALAGAGGKEAEFVLIQSGDTLWGIAERSYGNGARYQEIFEANREVIQNPDLIYPGQKIRIPR